MKEWKKIKEVKYDVKRIKSAHGLWKCRAVGMHSYQGWYALLCLTTNQEPVIDTHTHNERCSNVTLNINIK